MLSIQDDTSRKLLHAFCVFYDLFNFRIIPMEQNKLVKAINDGHFDQAGTLINEGERIPGDYPFFQSDQLYNKIIQAKSFDLLDLLLKNKMIQTDLYEYDSFDNSIFKTICRSFPTGESSLAYLQPFLKNFQNPDEEVKGHTLLSYALEAGADPAIIKALVQAGCRTDFRNKAQENLIFQVVNTYMPETKALAYLELLIDAGVDVNEPNIVQSTALHMAIERNRKYFIPVLLKNGASPNEQDKNGNTAFYFALAHQQNFETYTLLAEHESPDFSLMNREGESCLLGFVRFMQGGAGEIKLLSQLMDDGADLQQTAGWYGNEKSALEWIIEKPIEVLKMVIDKGVVNINEQDNDGNTLLHKVCAIDSNYSEEAARNTYRKVKLLLEAGADAGITNIKEETAMMLAANDNLKAKTVELLLQKQ